MSSSAKKIFDDALALPAEDRAALVDALTESLSADHELSPEWNAEIARRIDAVERGESRLIPWEEVEKRVRKALDQV